MHHGRQQAMRERLPVHVLGGLDVAVGGRPLVELASALPRTPSGKVMRRALR